jgi:hypothetical protein
MVVVLWRLAVKFSWVVHGNARTCLWRLWKGIPQTELTSKGRGKLVETPSVIIRPRTLRQPLTVRSFVANLVELRGM